MASLYRISAYAPIAQVVPNTASPGAHAATVTANLFDDARKLMTRYPRQVDREYLPYGPGGLNKIQVIDGCTVLLILTKISSRAIVGVGTSLNTNCAKQSDLQA